MSDNARIPVRRSPRLRDFDYAEPGTYFVTVCTANRACILGEVADGRMVMSEIGKIVEKCWQEIPGHFPNARIGALQVMPNHVHGIHKIVERAGRIGNPCRDVACNVPTVNTSERFSRISPKVASLSVIIRSFKSASTKRCHELDASRRRTLWQPRFYDRIIRSHKERYSSNSKFSWCLRDLVVEFQKEPGTDKWGRR